MDLSDDVPADVDKSGGDSGTHASDSSKTAAASGKVDFSTPWNSGCSRAPVLDVKSMRKALAAEVQKEENARNEDGSVVSSVELQPRAVGSSDEYKQPVFKPKQLTEQVRNRLVEAVKKLRARAEQDGQGKHLLSEQFYLNQLLAMTSVQIHNVVRRVYCNCNFRFMGRVEVPVQEQQAWATMGAALRPTFQSLAVYSDIVKARNALVDMCDISCTHARPAILTLNILHVMV